MKPKIKSVLVSYFHEVPTALYNQLYEMNHSRLHEIAIASYVFFKGSNKLYQLQV